MKRYTGFTIIELIFVVIILAILTSIGIRKLGNIGTDRYHAERCVNTIYGEIKNIYEFAKSQKTFKDKNGNEKAPDGYLITTIKDEKNNSRYEEFYLGDFIITGLSFHYINENQIHHFKDIYINKIPGCWQKNHFVLGFSNFTTGTLLIGLKNQGNERGFKLDTENLYIGKRQNSPNTIIQKISPFTGYLSFDLYEREDKSLSPEHTFIEGDVYNGAHRGVKSKIFFDSRSGLIKKSYCIKYAEDSRICKQWSSNIE